ncbi:MAG TPA: VOC family protein [Actinomycetota bacterium]|nr:VOC family protein [Actinomycetota bacterium]
MRLNHLALDVRDQRRSIDFYAIYFGFDLSTARRYPDGVVILHDGHGFALALGEDRWAGRAPGFPHFGFDLASPEEVRELRARLVTDGVELVEDEDGETYVGFKCLDPDRHVIEVSWET